MEHLQNEILGPRYEVRLRDLQAWHVLKVVCFECRRASLLAPGPLRARWPDHTRLIDLERRLRCGACGNRIENSLRVVRLPRD